MQLRPSLQGRPSRKYVTFQPGVWLLTSFSSTKATRLEGLNPQAADNLSYHILHIKKQKALFTKQDPAILNDDIGGSAKLLGFWKENGGNCFSTHR